MADSEQVMNPAEDAMTVRASDLDRDLGFGSVVSARRNIRLLNRDGSFNVKVLNGPVWDHLISYHKLLTISWTKFYLVVIGLYLVLNALFATLYVSCGANALAGQGPGTDFQ